MKASMGERNTEGVGGEREVTSFARNHSVRLNEQSVAAGPSCWQRGCSRQRAVLAVDTTH